jgi:hypothetical protein
MQTSRRVASYLYENNIYGYVTIDFLVQQSTSSSLKITLSGLKCYYDDFIACNELFMLFNENAEHKSDQGIFFPSPTFS